MVGEFGLCWCKCIVCFDEIVVFVGVSMVIVDCVLNECGSVFVQVCECVVVVVWQFGVLWQLFDMWYGLIYVDVLLLDIDVLFF